MSVAARSAISLFNVPYIALGAEMASDYGGPHQRGGVPRDGRDLRRR
jgi:Na+/melibiose symporter-like transporter